MYLYYTSQISSVLLALIHDFHALSLQPWFPIYFYGKIICKIFYNKIIYTIFFGKLLLQNKYTYRAIFTQLS